LKFFKKVEEAKVEVEVLEEVDLKEELEG